MTDTMFTIPVVRGIRTNPASGGSTAITVVGSDSGLIFANHNTSNVTYTLPSLADGKGKVFWFMNANTTSTLAITAPSTVMVLNDDIDATTNTCAADAGSLAMVTCDGTNYFCWEGKGTWTGT